MARVSVTAEKDPAKLRDAETEFRAALATDPGSRIADLHFNLGVVLMKQKPTPGAREPYAPDFSFVPAGGEPITSESLRGEVVLIDFWETECPRCVRAVSSLRRLQSDHAKDAFVVLGI